MLRRAEGPVVRSGPDGGRHGLRGSVTFEGVTSLDRTGPWGGRVAATAPPRLVGRPEVGRTVRAVSGTWSGGWGDEYDRLTVEACRDRVGRRCERVCEPLGGLLGEGDRATIPSRYRGWYLRAAAVRTPRDAVFAAIGIACRPGLAALRPGATTAVSATSARVTGPAVRLLSRAVGREGRLVFGTVRCSAECRVTLTVTDRRDRKARRRFVVETTGVLALDRGARLARGPVEVRVTVDGRAVASGSSRR